MKEATFILSGFRIVNETIIIIIIIIIMVTFIMRLLLQNKNTGAVQKYK